LLLHKLRQRDWANLQNALVHAVINGESEVVLDKLDNGFEGIPGCEACTTVNCLEFRLVIADHCSDIIEYIQTQDGTFCDTPVDREKCKRKVKAARSALAFRQFQGTC
jgi:hypothetical protein